MVYTPTLLPAYLIFITCVRILYSLNQIYSSSEQALETFFSKVYVIFLLDLIRLLCLPKLRYKKFFIFTLLSFCFEIVVFIISKIIFKTKGFVQSNGLSFIICFFSVIWMIFLWPCYVQDEIGPEQDRNFTKETTKDQHKME